MGSRTDDLAAVWPVDVISERLSRPDATTPVVARRRGKPGRMWRRRLTFLPFVLPGVAVFAVFTVWPLVQSFVLSLQRWDGFTAKTWVGLANYHRLFEDAAFWRSFEHTLVY